MNVSNSFDKSIVLYTSGNFIQKRMAYRISCALSKMTGMEIPFGKETIKRTAAKFVLKDNKTLTKGDWKIAIKGKTVTMSAGSYYGYYGIAQFLETEAAEELYALPDGYEKIGSYKDTVDLEPLKASARYAYDKQGDIRVMFYNVLFGHKANSWDGSRQFRVPPADRNALQAEMIKR